MQLAYSLIWPTAAIQYSRDVFVWKNEMGTERRELRGEQALCHRMLIREIRISPITKAGSINAEIFLDFLRGRLINSMPAPQSPLYITIALFTMHVVQISYYNLSAFRCCFHLIYSLDLNPKSH